MTDTTAPALVAEEAMPDADLSAAFDRITAADPIDEDNTEQVNEPAGGVTEEAETGQQAPEAEAAPTDLPAGVKSAWGSLTPEAREAVTNSHREMARKLADQTRFVNGMNPIREVLAQAAKDIPHLSAMKPEQVAAEVMTLARISRDFNEKPVETLLGLARKHNMEDQLRQALSAPQDTGQSALQNEISALKQQLQRVSDPEYLRSQVSAVSAETQIVSEVTKFAQGAEHWAEVEHHIPAFVPIMREKLGQGASAKDVLAAAYDAALTIYLPDVKAQAQAAATAAQPDPKTEAALKAKSVNVRATASGATRVLTEDEVLSAAFDRVHRK